MDNTAVWFETREQRPLLVGRPVPLWYYEATPRRRYLYEEDGVDLNATPETPSPLFSKNIKRLLKRITSVLTTFAVVAIMGLFAKGWYDEENLMAELRDGLQNAAANGVSASVAMVVPIVMFMPLQTVANHQTRYGTTAFESMKTLFADRGLLRFYDGLIPALFEGPLNRFIDVITNSSVLLILNCNVYARHLPTALQTVISSFSASLPRMLLAPINTLKTMLQTQGRDQGEAILETRVEIYGLMTMWYGALASGAEAFLYHYPWFLAFNYLETNVPLATDMIQESVRSAAIGLFASAACDLVTNPVRVVKTFRQVNLEPLSYMDAAREVIKADGLGGFWRGLKTRVVANGLQGSLFAVSWKLLMDVWDFYTDGL